MPSVGRRGFDDEFSEDDSIERSKGCMYAINGHRTADGCNATNFTRGTRFGYFLNSRRANLQRHIPHEKQYHDSAIAADRHLSDRSGRARRSAR
jgi:hypothetical protein